MNGVRLQPTSTAVHRGWRRTLGELPSALLFLLPTVAVLGTFNFYPALYSLYLSLFEWNGLSPHREFVGLANYTRLLASGEFWNSLRVTLLYAGGVTLLALALGLLVAVLLNQPIRGQALYRVLYFLPVITPTVASGVVWKYLFDPTQGVVNRGLAEVGLEGPSWLSDPSWALVAVIVVGVWKRVGFNMVVYLAALQGIPKTYYEAAQLDGADSWQQFRHITLPLLAPTTFFLVVTALIDAFQVFDLVYVMTSGGPLGSTDVLGYYLYRQGFRYSELGFASAVAYVMFALIFLVTVIQFRLTRGGQDDA
ncbi:carbohydrate ABC transporter permease [Meiothermus granaticius]|uniref:Lactose transport system permease protein LacF n=1 Tax=Meiothermus granaticius NBRC 107808 TaxID=1227551 RepID=A0A399F764_9DEIN|nr:sugar ABC transporter permease [Meiothermus granaticius]RIH91486.1 Lactose transport system permease protein LacF [Meiothermus granaticius NBRC 107808]GEM88278.1 ABC transporter permease [Meiothermus granaticius NBRC 107808]